MNEANKTAQPLDFGSTALLGVVAERAAALHDGCSMPLAQALELALSEALVPLRARGVLDADDNLDCWDTPPFEICYRHVKALNEKDPAALWRVAQLYVLAAPKGACMHHWKVTHSGVTYHDCRCDVCGETKRETWD